MPPGPVQYTPPHAIDLQATRYARLRAFIQIGEDATSDHIAGRIELYRVDVLG
jgi:hypothetical protein